MTIELTIEEIVERRTTRRVTLRQHVEERVSAGGGLPYPAEPGAALPRLGSERRIGPKPSPLLIAGPVARRVA